MFDLITIFTIGGVILWFKSLLEVKSTILDNFIKNVLLNELTTNNTYRINPYMIKYAQDNKLEICIAVIMQESFYVDGYEDLLRLLLIELRCKFGNMLMMHKCVSQIEFDKNYEQIYLKWKNIPHEDKENKILLPQKQEYKTNSGIYEKINQPYNFVENQNNDNYQKVNSPFDLGEKYLKSLNKDAIINTNINNYANTYIHSYSNNSDLNQKSLVIISNNDVAIRINIHTAENSKYLKSMLVELPEDHNCLNIKIDQSDKIICKLFDICEIIELYSNIDCEKEIEDKVFQYLDLIEFINVDDLIIISKNFELNEVFEQLCKQIACNIHIKQYTDIIRKKITNPTVISKICLFLNDHQKKFMADSHNMWGKVYYGIYKFQNEPTYSNYQTSTDQFDKFMEERKSFTNIKKNQF